MRNAGRVERGQAPGEGCWRVPGRALGEGASKARLNVGETPHPLLLPWAAGAMQDIGECVGLEHCCGERGYVQMKAEDRDAIARGKSPE